MNQDNAPGDLVMGVERSIIEKFLWLIKMRYPIVDKANFFLESKLDVSGSTIAMANQRDFISHLCTVLTEEDLSVEKKLDQVSAAEEHLRRAVIESYHNAVSLKLTEVLKDYRKYIETVIPFQKTYPELASSPNIKTIRATLREIENLQIQARDAKRWNKWDEKWEEGIKTYLEAFLKAEQLGDTLENYLSIASQIPVKSESNKLSYWQYISIFSLCLNIIFIILFIIFK